MAAHSSILAWRTLWTEEPGGRQSMGRRELDTTEHTQMYTSAVVAGRHKAAHAFLHLAAGTSNISNPRTPKTHTGRFPPRSLCSHRTLWSSGSKDAARKCTKDQSWHFTSIIFSPVNIHRVHSFIPGTRYYLRRGNVFKLVLKNNL